MKLVDLDCGEFRLPVTNMSAARFDEFSKEVVSLDFHTFKSVH